MESKREREIAINNSKILSDVKSISPVINSLFHLEASVRVAGSIELGKMGDKRSKSGATAFFLFLFFERFVRKFSSRTGQAG